MRCPQSSGKNFYAETSAGEGFDGICQEFFVLHVCARFPLRLYVFQVAVATCLGLVCTSSSVLARKYASGFIAWSWWPLEDDPHGRLAALEPCGETDPTETDQMTD